MMCCAHHQVNQSGNPSCWALWHRILWYSPRDAPGMAGTAKGKEFIWTRERIPHVVGYFSTSFQFPKQKDFLAS